jgi:hypothetical protein
LFHGQTTRGGIEVQCQSKNKSDTFSDTRLALTAQGLVRYTLKTPYRDGTTHVMFEPLDFIFMG